MDKIKVTVAVITKNEEKNIAHCIESVKWADEVVVVDGFSTDRTVEIARSMGAKVVQHKFTGRFADDRNVANDTARNDWVLHIDADDVATDGFRVKLGEALTAKGDYVVYKFRRKNFFLNHPMDHGGFHHFIPNLVNKKFVRYEGEVHEVPVYKGKEGVIEADIEHYPFDSIEQFVARQNRYSSLAVSDIYKKEGLIKEPIVRKNMMRRSFGIFWKSYVKKQGHKEGFYGLIFAVLFAFINFMKWAKYWETYYGNKGGNGR